MFDVLCQCKKCQKWRKREQTIQLLEILKDHPMVNLEKVVKNVLEEQEYSWKRKAFLAGENKKAKE